MSKLSCVESLCLLCPVHLQRKVKSFTDEEILSAELGIASQLENYHVSLVELMQELGVVAESLWVKYS